MLNLFALELDGTIIGLIVAGTVTLIGSLTGAIVTVMNAVWAARDKHDQLIRESRVNEKFTAVVESTKTIAEKTMATDAKLDEINTTTKVSAENVNGNLHEVREALKKQTEHSQALQTTVDKLTEILKNQLEKAPTPQRPARATDTAVVDTLKQIESNTAVTANNTATQGGSEKTS